MTTIVFTYTLFRISNTYKQRQTEIGKKIKQMLSNNFCYLEISRTLHPRYHPQYHSKDNRKYSKTIVSVFMTLYYTIYHNENEDENE